MKRYSYLHHISRPSPPFNPLSVAPACPRNLPDPLPVSLPSRPFHSSSSTPLLFFSSHQHALKVPPLSSTRSHPLLYILRPASLGSSTCLHIYTVHAPRSTFPPLTHAQRGHAKRRPPPKPFHQFSTILSSSCTFQPLFLDPCLHSSSPRPTCVSFLSLCQCSS